MTEAAVFSFDTRLDRVTPFTSDIPSLETALDHVQSPHGQTSLYDDAVAETGRKLAQTSAGRRAVVVLTDGDDNASHMSAAEVSGIASSIDIPVYIVAVVSMIDDPRNAVGVPPEMTGALPDLSRWTGGEMFVASSTSALIALPLGRSSKSYGISTSSRSRLPPTARDGAPWRFAPAIAG